MLAGSSRTRAWQGAGATLAGIMFVSLLGQPAMAEEIRERFGGVTCTPEGCTVRAGKAASSATGARSKSSGPSPKAPPARSGGRRAVGSAKWELPDLKSSHGFGGIRGGMAPFLVPPGAQGRSKGQPGKAKRKVSVAEVAQAAVEQLRLPRPVIRTSPAADFTQVVHVPTWMWVQSSSWGPVSESASVDGVTVTATARPRKAVWSMGDGASVVCHGPGTPYSARFGAHSSSPDCGHTYRRASFSEPGGKYRVRVRVVWDVTWRGAGDSGVVPGIAMTAEQSLSVDEVQAVVTA